MANKQLTSELILTRINQNEKQTIGVMILLQNDELKHYCVTLELPDKQNQRNISRIPKGIYTIKKRHSKKYGEHIILDGVQNRSFILIHSGNYYTNTRGCILIGSTFKDINKDGQTDVINSRKTLDDLLFHLPTQTIITIQ